MTIKNLKEYLNQFPKELDNYQVVYCEADTLYENKWYRKDMPVESAIVDDETKELCIGVAKTIDFIENKNND